MRVEGLRVERTFIYGGGNKTPHSHAIEVAPCKWLQYDEATQMIIIGKMWIPESHYLPGKNVGELSVLYRETVDALMQQCRSDIKSTTLGWMSYGSMEGLKIGLHERRLIDAACEWFVRTQNIRINVVTF